MKKPISFRNMREATVAETYRLRDEIELNPSYQREGDVWSVEKRQLLIDSVLNGFDLPKFYLHELGASGGEKRFAVIDGQQRLQALWGFMRDEFPLAQDFDLLESGTPNISGRRYSELGMVAPSLKREFDFFPLSIVTIATADESLIEDMFCRLNEGAPLSAAEKRRAIGGPVMDAVARLVQHEFFVQSVPFRNHRSRHADVAVKLLFLEFQQSISDTKRESLDRFAKSFGRQPSWEVEHASRRTEEVLGELSRLVRVRDPIFRSVGLVPVFYWLFRTLRLAGHGRYFQSNAIEAFLSLREQLKSGDGGLPDAEAAACREFFRLSQTPNDASSIAFRVRVLIDRLVPGPSQDKAIEALGGFAMDRHR